MAWGIVSPFDGGSRFFDGGIVISMILCIRIRMVIGVGVKNLSGHVLLHQGKRLTE